MSTIIFTSDIDWAPEEVIEDTIELFVEAGIPCTFFSTHQSPALDNLISSDQFEVGIHPNFNPLLFDHSDEDVDAVLDKILNLYPKALGVRSHSMTQSSGIIAKFVEKGLFYEANHFLPFQDYITPFRLWNGIIRIPFNWEDDTHWHYGNHFDDLGLDISEGKLNVLDFHPIHIFINTENQERYDVAKKYYQDSDKLLEYRNTSEIPGTRDLLINLMAEMKDSEIRAVRMLDFAKEFDNKNPVCK